MPVVLFLAFSTKAPIKQKLQKIILLGGDTDTCAAIIGGILGAGFKDHTPLKQDASSIMDWSIDIQTLDQIATELTCSIAQPRTVKLKLESGPLIFIQNLIFLSVVLIHGLRRHFPPY